MRVEASLSGFENSVCEFEGSVCGSNLPCVALKLQCVGRSFFMWVQVSSCGSKLRYVVRILRGKNK